MKQKENYSFIKIPKQYVVDFDKVNNFDDLKNIVQILYVGLPITISENVDFFEDIKEYLVEKQ